ncbi:monocarboxylate transporter 7-like isoform X2 [Dermacentor variabilis]|uniref:monocarboxylate transporter 7-like isoform X2 n=1 Tax=Dermacentor variabilis TaxID=34621 RepID=UPI003F5BEB8C
MVCALRRIKMDSPRSWLVAAACCWINVFSFALVRSAAVVYVSLLQAFPVTRQRASWPVNLSVVCCFLTGPIAGVMARYISIWKLSVVGCLGGSLAVCACSFAPSMLFLDVFLGIVHELVDTEKVGVCFGIANAAAGLVGLSRPLLIGFFRDTHGDYAGLFSLTGGSTMFVSLLWLYYRVREQCTSRRKHGNSPGIGPKRRAACAHHEKSTGEKK